MEQTVPVKPERLLKKKHRATEGGVARQFRPVMEERDSAKRDDKVVNFHC